MIRTAALVSPLSAGPAFAGDSVMWGEVGRTGALRIMQATPGQDPVLVHRLRPAENSSLVALEASSDRFALMVSIARRIDGDRWVIPVRASGGPFAGPVERLRAPCDGNGTIAVDGDRIAVAATCGVAIHAPAGVTTIDAGEVRNVALAGRYLVWTGDDVVVHDLASGTDVVRLTRRELGSGYVDEVAVHPDGAVAFSYGDDGWQRIAWAAPGTPGARRLDAAPHRDGLRRAGGRVLYERRSGPRHGRRVLLLRSLSDGTVRRLARFTDRRSRIGDLDLEPGRAAWGVTRSGKRMRIVVRDL